MYEKESQRCVPPRSPRCATPSAEILAPHRHTRDSRYRLSRVSSPARHRGVSGTLVYSFAALSLYELSMSRPGLARRGRSRHLACRRCATGRHSARRPRRVSSSPAAGSPREPTPRGRRRETSQARRARADPRAPRRFAARSDCRSRRPSARMPCAGGRCASSSRNSRRSMWQRPPSWSLAGAD